MAKELAKKIDIENYDLGQASRLVFEHGNLSEKEKAQIIEEGERLRAGLTARMKIAKGRVEDRQRGKQSHRTSLGLGVQGSIEVTAALGALLAENHTKGQP